MALLLIDEDFLIIGAHLGIVGGECLQRPDPSCLKKRIATRFRGIFTGKRPRLASQCFRKRRLFLKRKKIFFDLF